jgi:hypothetical protein
MTNDEARMTNEWRNGNDETTTAGGGFSSFVIAVSILIRALSFAMGGA